MKMAAVLSLATGLNGLTLITINGYDAIKYQLKIQHSSKIIIFLQKKNHVFK